MQGCHPCLQQSLRPPGSRAGGVAASLWHPWPWILMVYANHFLIVLYIYKLARGLWGSLKDGLVFHRVDGMDAGKERGPQGESRSNHGQHTCCVQVPAWPRGQSGAQAAAGGFS